MGKFEFELEVKELKLRVKTDNPNPNIAKALGTQLSNVLTTGVTIQDTPFQELPARQEEDNDRPRKKRNRKSASGSSQGSPATDTFDWVNNPANWGAPSQSWSVLDKGVWLLYVIEKECSVSQASIRQLSDTFNKHFKQSKVINPSNLSRDFGKKKTGANALLGEDTTVNPGQWFLTEEGKKYAVKVISDSKANGAG